MSVCAARFTSQFSRMLLSRIRRRRVRVVQVIISSQAHKLVKDHFSNIQLFPDNYCRIRKEQNYNPMRKQNKVNMLQQSLDDPLLEVKVKGYIPGAVLRNLRPDSPEDEHWSNEVRQRELRHVLIRETCAVCISVCVCLRLCLCACGMKKERRMERFTFSARTITSGRERTYTTRVGSCEELSD